MSKENFKYIGKTKKFKLYDYNGQTAFIPIEQQNKNNKIEYVGKQYDLTYFFYDYPEVAFLLKDLCDKNTELIDEVNKLKGVE